MPYSCSNLSRLGVMLLVALARKQVPLTKTSHERPNST